MLAPRSPQPPPLHIIDMRRTGDNLPPAALPRLSDRPRSRFWSPPRNSLSRRAPAVGLASIWARGHRLRSYGSHWSNISENAAIISYIAPLVNRVEIYFFPMAGDRFFLYPRNGRNQPIPHAHPRPPVLTLVSTRLRSHQ